MPFLTAKQMDGRLRTLRKSGYNTVNASVQELAVSIVNHANETGDCNRAKTLVRCVPPKMRSMLIKWFAEVSPINVTMGANAGEDTAKFRKETARSYNAFDIERAKANNWFDNPFNVEVESSAKTFEEFTSSSIETLFTRMANMAKPESDKLTDAAKEDVQALRAHLRAAYVEFCEQRDNGGETQETDGEQEEQTDDPLAPAREATA